MPGVDRRVEGYALPSTRKTTPRRRTDRLVHTAEARAARRLEALELYKATRKVRLSAELAGIAPSTLSRLLAEHRP